MKQGIGFVDESYTQFGNFVQEIIRVFMRLDIGFALLFRVMIGFLGQRKKEERENQRGGLDAGACPSLFVVTVI